MTTFVSSLMITKQAKLITLVFEMMIRAVFAIMILVVFAILITVALHQ